MEELVPGDYRPCYVKLSEVEHRAVVHMGLSTRDIAKALHLRYRGVRHQGTRRETPEDTGPGIFSCREVVAILNERKANGSPLLWSRSPRHSP